MPAAASAPSAPTPAAPPAGPRLSERRYSAWQVLGFAAVTLAVVGAACLAGFAVGFRFGKASARVMSRGYVHPPSFSLPADPNTIPVPGERAYLGVTYVELTPELARREGLNVTEGALIRRVRGGSPAQAADLRNGDVILAVDGAPVGSSHDLRELIEASPPGHSVTLTILRAGQTIELTVTLGSATSP